MKLNSFFVLPPDFNELKRRLISRETESLEDLNLRLRNAPLEISKISYYDYAIVNDNLDEAVDMVRCIIYAERHRLCKEKIEYFLNIFGGAKDERDRY